MPGPKPGALPLGDALLAPPDYTKNFTVTPGVCRMHRIGHLAFKVSVDLLR